jgi:uncharacterized protein YbjT (DUF2867 family)
MALEAMMIGTTGLVGSQLLELLLGDTRFPRIVSLARRPSGRVHEKLTEHLVDFRAPAAWADRVRGDVLFSSLGTTIRDAGSKEAQREVDHTFQLRVAEIAARNGVPTYVLVSAQLANPNARSFYPRMKGELERDVQKLGFPRVRILRPGLLLGERAESRLGESVGIGATRVLGLIPGLRWLRPIPASDVARAMIAAALSDEPGVRILENQDLRPRS